MKAIVYSLFGYERDRSDNCFDFNSYLRGLMINIRFNRLIYPGWDIILETDKYTYDAFKSLFDKLKESNTLIVNINDNQVPLTKAMLWRLKPVYETQFSKWKYTHILCRDLDSPATYRERQAVEQWIRNDKTMHAITDSVSHTLPLLGGMIGIRPDYFTERVNAKCWDDLIALGGNINYSVKGADQEFLNMVVYPKVSHHGNDSITQHYFKGMPNTFLSDFHTCTCDPVAGHRDDCPNNFPISLEPKLKESNTICGHIGAAGYYETQTFRFIKNYQDKFEDLIEIEKEYPKIFYWA